MYLRSRHINMDQSPCTGGYNCCNTSKAAKAAKRSGAIPSIPLLLSDDVVVPSNDTFNGSMGTLDRYEHVYIPHNKYTQSNKNDGCMEELLHHTIATLSH